MSDVSHRLGAAPTAGLAASAGAEVAQTGSTRTPLPIMLMLILVIMVPIEFSMTLGGLFLTPAKVFLLIMAFAILPRVFKMKLQAFDWLIAAHAIWSAVAHLKTYGSAGTQGAGLYVLEFLIVYLIMRVYMVRLEQFRSLVRLLFILVAVSIAVAIPEALTGQRYIHDFGRALTGLQYTYTQEYRLGILRSASFFEHQILFGIFCSAPLGLLWFTSTAAGRALKVPILFLGSFLAASSAPLLAFVLQMMLIGVERVSRKMKNRVGIISLIALVLGLILQYGTNRGVVGTLAIFTLNPLTAYYRREQWTFGIDDVMANPFFGFDATTWTRPFWMGPSVDNNWLLMMMRSGIPSVIFLFVGILFIWRALAARGMDVPLLFDQLRKGWGVLILAVLFTGATVAFFGKLQPMFSFYIGLGAALAVCPLPRLQAEGTLPAVPALGRAGPAYTRFPAGAALQDAPGRAAPPLSRAPAAPAEQATEPPAAGLGYRRADLARPPREERP